MAEAVMANGEVERKVMVAIDENEYSHYALMWVLDNLKESITKSTLVIFMAQPPPQVNYTFAASIGSASIYCPLSPTLELVNAVRERHKKLAVAILQRAKEICASRGVYAETITEEGDPQAAICDMVKKLHIDLLVVGESGLGKIKRAFLGSVSNYCAKNANCPVLVVKKP